MLHDEDEMEFLADKIEQLEAKRINLITYLADNQIELNDNLKRLKELQDRLFLVEDPVERHDMEDK